MDKKDYEFRAPGSPQATGNEWHEPLWPAAVAALVVFACCVTFYIGLAWAARIMAGAP